MRNLGSKLFVLLVAAAVVVGLGYAFLPEPVDVDLVTVERGDLLVTVDEDGKTRIREKYTVSAPLNGRILRISLDPGDPVQAGKTLLTMIEPRDPELLDARTVAQAEARVKAAEAVWRQAEPRLEQARVAQADAEADLVRARKAAQSQAIPQSELEDAEFAYRQRSEEVRAARIAEEIARFELEQAKAALIRSKPRTDEPPSHSPSSSTSVASGNGLQGNGAPGNGAANHIPNDVNGWNLPIYSPINGRVLRVLQESAAVVTPGAPLVELGDPLDLEVEIDVLSRDAVRIKPNDLVLLEHWGGTRPLNGRVRVIEPSGFTKISTLGVEEQRVFVIVDLVDPPEERSTLGDGFRVEGRVVIDEARNVLKVPTSAVFRVGEASAVFRVIEGVVHQQTVHIGRQNGLEAEILEGLAEGDYVVLHPSDQIEDGVAVLPR
jgi:HlyD family secretion protein